MSEKTTTNVGTLIFPYFGYNSHDMVSGNGAPPWLRGVGYIEGGVLIDL